jgi:hypothetical protein
LLFFCHEDAILYGSCSFHFFLRLCGSSFMLF